MRILIASTIVPFIEGGGTFIVDWLDQTLKEYGYNSEILKIPFHSHYEVMFQQILALRLFDIQDRVDRLIAVRTPSYVIKHPNKVIWFIHHHRGAYDLWGTQFQDIPRNKDGLKIKQSIIQADNTALKEAQRVYANSKVVADRLKKYNQVVADVLYPPLMKPERFHCKEYGNYIFYPARLAFNKRQTLAVKAMKYTRSNVKLIVAGHPDSKEDLDNLMSLVVKNNLRDKVKIIGRWITEEEKIGLFANSLGCVYVPIDEDSYGYTSLEAYYSKKAIVTCSDSGGTLEIVQDELNGLITQPNPRSIAKAFDKLYWEKLLAKKMGQEGYDKLLSMNINWDNVVRRLVS